MVNIASISEEICTNSSVLAPHGFPKSITKASVKSEIIESILNSWSFLKCVKNMLVYKGFSIRERLAWMYFVFFFCADVIPLKTETLSNPIAA